MPNKLISAELGEFWHDDTTERIYKTGWMGADLLCDLVNFAIARGFLADAHSKQEWHSINNYSLTEFIKEIDSVAD